VSDEISKIAKAASIEDPSLVSSLRTIVASIDEKFEEDFAEWAKRLPFREEGSTLHLDKLRAVAADVTRWLEVIDDWPDEIISTLNGAMWLRQVEGSSHESGMDLDRVMTDLDEVVAACEYQIEDAKSQRAGPPGGNREVPGGPPPLLLVDAVEKLENWWNANSREPWAPKFDHAGTGKRRFPSEPLTPSAHLLLAVAQSLDELYVAENCETAVRQLRRNRRKVKLAADKSSSAG
jgi:hypothetical protein